MKKQIRIFLKKSSLQLGALLGLFVLMMGVSPWLQAQESPDRRANVVYGGFLSHGSIVSAGYERHIPLGGKFSLIGHIGVGYGEDDHILELFTSTPLETYITIPHSATVAFGGKRLLVEAGLGGNQFFGTNVDDDYYFLYPLAGVRLYLFRQQRFLLRASVHYPFNASTLESTNILFSPVGVSFGYSF